MEIGDDLTVNEGTHKLLSTNLQILTDLTMSEPSNVSSFIAKNKVAIAATVGVVASAAAAYYVLSQQPGATTDTSSSKKKKKSKGKSQSVNKIKKRVYPADAEGFPALTAEIIAALSDEDKEKYALALKEDGNELFKEKKFEDAIKFYSAALELKEDQVFYSNRSACYVGLQEYEKVIEDTTAALKIQPDYTKCLIRRAAAYEQVERYEDAMFDLTAVTVFGGFNNKSTEAALDRVLKKLSFKVVESRMKSRVPELPSASSTSSFFGAFDDEPTVEGLPEDPEQLEPQTGDFFLISALKELSRRSYESYEKADVFIQQAVSAYKKEFESKPEDDSLKRKLAIAYEYSGSFKFLKAEPLEALKDIESALELNARSRAYVFQALILADKQDFEKAAESFDKAIAAAPESGEAYYHKAQMYYLTNELEKAKENFTKAKELNPDNVYAYIQLACIAYRAGNFPSAEEQFQDAKKKFPTSPEIPNYYGEILGDSGDQAGALKQFEISYKLQEALSKISVGVIPLTNRAAMLSRTPTPENISAATALLEKAIDIDPKADLAKITLAQLKLQDNKAEEAVKLFEEAAELSRSVDEKLQATSFAEASKVQLRIRADPVLNSKIQELMAQYGAQGL